MRPGLLALFILLVQDDKLRKEYEDRLAKAPQNAKGQFDLGRWCDAKRLKAEAEQAYGRALELDPEFEAARKALGQKKVLGRWVNDKLYKDPSWWAHPKVDQKRVDDAIVKGCDYLLQLCAKGLPGGAHSFGGIGKIKVRYDELVLLTVLESGWDPKDPRVGSLLQKVLSNPLDLTYHVALKAMALSAIDPIKYQQQLAQCAQFLVDNQHANGSWSYGAPTQLPPAFPASDKGPIGDISTGPDTGNKAPKLKQIEIKKGKSVAAPETDTSNAQYAALGIRACLSGLVIVPKETIAAAEGYWEKLQEGNGGWGYGAPDRMPADCKDFGSMTAGALGSLAIYKYYRSRVWGESVDIKSAPAIVKGIAWMGQNLDYGKNPKAPFGAWKYYWFYATERAGRLLETETFGAREWYPEGAQVILGLQQADGSFAGEVWVGIPAGAMGTLKDIACPKLLMESCFSLLFLKRGTPKLGETIKIRTGGSAGK
jgi:hypothetical protein